MATPLKTPIPPKTGIVIGGRVLKPVPPKPVKVIPNKPKKSSFAKAYIKFSEVMQKELKSKGGNVDKLVKMIDEEMDEQITTCVEKKKVLEEEMEKLTEELKVMKGKVLSCKRKMKEVEKTMEDMKNHKKMKGLVSAGIQIQTETEKEDEQEEEEASSSEEEDEEEEDEEEAEAESKDY